MTSQVWGPAYAHDWPRPRLFSRRRQPIEHDSGHPLLIKTMPGSGYYLSGG